MATLKEAQSYNTSLYSPVDPPQASPALAPGTGTISFTRCPIPNILTQSPDALAKFYKGGAIPQFRFLSPVGASGTIAGTTVIKTTITSSSSSSSSSSGSTGKLQQVAAHSPVLGPNGPFSTTLQIANAFQLVSLNASGPCRFQMYGTPAAQKVDAGRGLDVPPPAGTMQNLITDVALDTAPYTWGYQNRIGANGEGTGTATIYVTVTNLAQSSAVVTVTLSYVALT